MIMSRIRFICCLLGATIAFGFNQVEAQSGNLTLGKSTSTIVDTGYNSSPGLAVLPNGYLIAAYRKGDDHIFGGKLYYKISKDRGATWGSETLMYETGDEDFEVRAPSVTVLQDRSLIVSMVRNNLDRSIIGVYTFSGTQHGDGSLSWGEPSEVDISFTEFRHSAANVIELQNGDLILPVYGSDVGDGSNNYTQAVMRSTDGGLTWGSQVNLFHPTNTALAEGNISVLPTGRLVMMIRQNKTPKSYYMSYSDDQGFTWSTPTNVLNAFNSVGRPSVQSLPSGALLLVARCPDGSCYSTSWDGASTWTALTLFNTNQSMYSSTVLLSSGEVAAINSYEVSETVSPVEFLTFYDGFGIFSQGYSTLKSLDLKTKLTVGENAGIGTVTPNSTLEIFTVAGSTNPTRVLLSDGDNDNPFTSLTSAGVALQIQPLSSTAGGLFMGGYSDNSTTAFVFRGLMGTTNPPDTSPVVQFRSGKLSGTTGGTLGPLETAYQFSDWDGVTDWVTVLGSGNVGIGTVSPSDLLHLNTGNVRVGSSAGTRSTVSGNNQLILFDGTAPVGTLSNGVSLYSDAGELRVMDSAGNSTLLSPHENENNYWVFDSINAKTGKRLVIDMELLAKKINEAFGWDFVHESIGGVKSNLETNAARSIDRINSRIAALEEIIHKQ